MFDDVDPPNGVKWCNGPDHPNSAKRRSRPLWS